MIKGGGLYNELVEYAENKPYPFHMPGHKGAGLFLDGVNPLLCDITEITGFDNLQSPEGLILQSQRAWARLLGADESFFCVNGTTGANIAALLSAAADGQRVIVARNCHKSVYSALVFTGAVPVYIYPEMGDGMCGRVSPDEVRRAVRDNPESRAVVVTSPTFAGSVSDIQAIAEAAHSEGMLLIVDEAHGAHLAFSPYFPSGALSHGADIVTHSIHKTLPSLTQTSVVSIKRGRADRARLAAALAMVQSTSPSYLLMASLDYCRRFLETEGEKAFADYIKRLEDIRGFCGGLNNIRLFDGGRLYDRGKLLLGCSGGGYKAAQILREDYNIELEMAEADYLLAMTSVMDTDSGFAQFKRGLAAADASISLCASEPVYWEAIELPRSATPREAFFCAKEEVELGCAAGRISGGFITPYPPGIPIAAPGELITEDAVIIINRLIKQGAAVHGVSAEGKIQAVERAR